MVDVTVEKRPEAWRATCDVCWWRGDWRDRRGWAAEDLAEHRTDRHGGTQRAGE